MQRLDQLLVEQALTDSRNRAQRLIKEGRVSVSTPSGFITVTKPSVKVDSSSEIRVEQSPQDKYVSRAGLKLEGAINALDFDFTGKSVLDVGCSTGGFSDCALKHGADLVVGIDVGHDQLHPSLRANPKVFLYEGVNARRLPDAKLRQHASEGFDVIVMDVSFISQTLILPELSKVLGPTGDIITLIKPQFELQKDDIGRGGIVRNPAMYERVKERIIRCCEDHHLVIHEYLESPITGSDGNREFLALIRAS